MKHIGIVGGLSPESTIDYYRILCRAYNERFGGVHFPEMTIRSINLEEMFGYFKSDDWQAAARRILAALHDLKAAGADFAAIASNTPHNAYDIFAPKAPLPVVAIMDATADAIIADNITTVGLLGTAMTMECGFFQRAFERRGIHTLIPDREDRAYVNESIWKELTHGIVRQETKARYIEIITRLINNDAQGIILGCTELPLIVRPGDIPVKTYDTAEIHAVSILNYAMHE